MKKLILFLLLPIFCFADTPPPGTVKAKMYTGDGVTALTATGSALNVNVTNTSGLTTVNQGNAGSQSWLTSVTASALPTNAAQETGGHLESIDSKLTSPLAVTGTFFQATQPVSGTFFQATQPVSGTFFQETQPVSGTFFQDTQPVSLLSLPSLATGANTIGNVNINGTVPVSISGTVTTTSDANGLPGSSAPAKATQVGGVDSGGNLVVLNVASDGTLAVDGSAVTQPVSLTSLPPLASGTNVIGHVIVDSAPTTAVTQSGTWTVNSKPATPTALTVSQAAISVGTSAVRLTVSGSAPLSTRVLLVAQLDPDSVANCFLGSASVTDSGATRGAQMFAGQSFSFSNDAGDYYAICDTSAQTFFITEQE